MTKHIVRAATASISRAVKRGKSVLVLGPRQTGKTTLLRRLGCDLEVSLMRPDARQRYERDPSLLIGEVESLSGEGRKPIVLVDEVQRVPELLDAVQDLSDRRVARFMITGSSARKLRRRSEVNLLPGRLVALRLDPLSLRERLPDSIEEALLDGALPGIVTQRSKRDREIDLESYVTTYLEEEVRAEAIVRKLGPFARFLELAAAESGQISNFRKLSQQVGVTHATIASYYQVLEDCLIAERVEPLTQSNTRKKLTRSNRYLIFDMGVRRLAAREGRRPSRTVLGALFEQFVGLELIRAGRMAARRTRLRFWRDPDGPEVDWIVEREGEYLPVEVKLTDAPSLKDARHLEVFLSEYANAPLGYVVCQTPRRVQLRSRVVAIPWQDLPQIV